MTPWSRATATAPSPPARDLPPHPGVTFVEGGVDIAIYAGHADAVEVCLFDDDDVETRVPLTERAHGWWWAFVPDVGPGQRYAVRAVGPWDPVQGLRYNEHKLLLDPYARFVEGEVAWGPAVYGHAVDDNWRGDDEIRSTLDSAASMPRCVVVDPAFDWGEDRAPRHAFGDSLIYEVHVRNLTATHPGIPVELRGTYAGLAHPAAIAHLKDLGVTAVELLPVHAFTDEPELVRRGLVNHWGYNTLSFFAPHAAYARADDPQGVLAEFKGMVKLLHAQGIEVILDVVYNHTAEQTRAGATLSWRGLDNRAYYRLDERGRDVDVTGCGNTLDLRHPMQCRMVLDSLRYWASECHVDGFRFDLAVALGRNQADEFDPNHPFLVALRTDPVLSHLKLIAEPWDLGIHGWRTGQFPPPFSEWNDRYRDTVRTFWLPDLAADVAGQAGHGVHDLATRLAGSQDLFGARGRGPIASVNFVAAHDGFTTADLTAYDVKHNGPNGEGNRDGSEVNRSWNHGVEGPTRDAAVNLARRRSLRNLLGTLFLSTGVPMLNAGDELGRSQQGNNNAYCQDNAISWFDWNLEEWQADLLATTRFLSALRREHPVLRQRHFLDGRPGQPHGSADLDWYDAAAQLMTHQWGDGHERTLQLLLDGRVVGSESLLVVLHGGAHDREVMLPTAPGVAAYQCLWDSTWERPGAPSGQVAAGPVDVGASSIRVYRVVDPGRADT